MTLNRMIRSIRTDLGITQSEMASALSISDAYMSHLENGKRTAEVRYKDGVYWDLAKLASSGTSKQCWDMYISLIGLDLEWRDPMIYEAIGRHFYQQFFIEESQLQSKQHRPTSRRKRRSTLRKASNH